LKFAVKNFFEHKINISDGQKVAKDTVKEKNGEMHPIPEE